jgi:DNA repair protein RadC
MDYISIKNWAADDRPREKLQIKGLQSVSDAELLAIIIGSGTRETSAVELARHILLEAGNSLGNLGKKSVADLTKIKGIGKAKAINIVAAMELGRRRKMAETTDLFQVSSSKDIYEYISPVISDLSYEEFWVIYLNRANKIMERYKLSQGGISGTVTDIRLILKRALELLATSLIICHNHPSGNINPSEQDKQITDKLKTASAQMDIKLLDHIIVSDKMYFSFCDEGLL